MREFIVGLVFLVLIGVLLGVTLWVNDPGFLQPGAQHPLSARFNDVSGLKKGNEVWLFGTPAGRVTNIAPDGRGGVLVEMDLDEDPELRTNCDVKIRSGSALGGMVVAIHPGTPDQPLRAPGVIGGVVVKDGLQGLGELVADVQKGEGLLGRLIYDKELGNKFDDIATNLKGFSENAEGFSADIKAITADVRSGKGTLGKLFTQDKLYNDLEEAVASLRKLGEEARSGGGVIDVLLHDKELARNIQETAERLNSVATKLDKGEGTLGKLINDPTLYDSLAATAEDARAVVADVRGGNGILGRLIYDEKWANRVDNMTKDLAQITGKLRRGEGTLGRLIQDEVLYSDLREALQSLTAGAGDVRENAPILVFTGFLFGAF